MTTWAPPSGATWRPTRPPARVLGWHSLALAALITTLGVCFASTALAEQAAMDPGAAAASSPTVASPEAASPEQDTPVKRQSVGRGFAFGPSRPEANGFRLGLGVLFDAVDPQVMYGFYVRVPQITLDARYGLGSGWSLKGHLNTILVINELTLGVGYTWQFGRLSLEASASAGIYYGRLGQLGFDAQFIAGEYRPELALGWDLGDVMLSLRGSLILMGPQRASVGELWGGFDNADAFAGHSEMLYVENTTAGNHLWYLGIGSMTTLAYYQLWLLFPDSPAYYTYPRLVAGYEF